jgi:hypothetical protein
VYDIATCYTAFLKEKLKQSLTNFNSVPWDVVKNSRVLYRIWGSQSGGYKGFYILGYNSYVLCHVYVLRINVVSMLEIIYVGLHNCS